MCIRDRSNHARQTAAAAARLGMGCELVLPRIVPRSDEEYEQSGNVLLDRLLVTAQNQHLIPENDLAEWDAAIEEFEAKQRKPDG